MTVGKGTVLQPEWTKIFKNEQTSKPLWMRSQWQKQPEEEFRWFNVLQSSAMSGAVGTSCGKSQTGVMSVVSG